MSEHALREQPPHELVGPADSYEALDGQIVHWLEVGALSIEASVPAEPDSANDPKGGWWRAYLEGRLPTPFTRRKLSLRTADLFCGPGGLANGLRQLCTEAGVAVISALAVDQDDEATRVYATNHGTRVRSSASVASLVDSAIRRTSSGAEFLYRPELTDEMLGHACSGVQVVLAGPPCQGHSNLNNHTRRSDPRNSLYLTVPAFVVAIDAPICVIENVPEIRHDSDGVVETAIQLFESSGYTVTNAVLSAADMGWPQSRKRHFLVARRDAPPLPLADVADLLREEQARSFWWAVGDLEDRIGSDPMEQVTTLSAENKARIDWLFDNDQYDLALPERPKSHRQGTTYVSVYGRLRKDEPAPTITTGFMSPGRGRYVHSTRRRVLTAREAARLQGFPDTYDFSPNPASPSRRSKLAKWIGDAVPMPLGYAASLAALGKGWPTPIR